MLSELRKQANILRPRVRIGKNGLTDSVIEEIKLALKRDKTIKINIGQNSSAEISQVTDELMKKTGAKLIKKVGKTITIHKA